MLIKKKPTWQLSENDVTDEALMHSRRDFMMMAAAVAGASAIGGVPLSAADERVLKALAYKSGANDLSREITDRSAATGYNNFYEFGTGKSDPAKNAHTMKVSPWTVEVEGHVEKTGKYDLHDLIDFNTLEERIYRLRCVETWSMVVPWIGVPLSAILSKFNPTSNAKFVQFETLADPKSMPGISSRVLSWPYVEGLRMDEAMNPLTLMAVGMYGKELPNQNGAPMRLVVPWKYGYKSIKSIVKIKFVSKQPRTSWGGYSNREYGFYSNVNPEVDHPRWSQKTEQRIGEFRRRDTLMFNGYGGEVAELYKGMDLRKNH